MTVRLNVRKLHLVAREIQILVFVSDDCNFLMVLLYMCHNNRNLSLFVSFVPTCRRPTLRSTTRRYLSKNDKNAGRPSTKQHQKEMLEFIDQPMESTVGDGASLSMDSQQQQEILDLVYCIAKAADGRKAENIVALHVHPVSTLTSYLVILSGNSRPQNQAIAAAITKDVQEQFDLRPGGSKGVPEGTADSGWMLLDYGTVMVHIMTPKSRLYYNVEGQWKDKGGVALDLSHVLIPNSALSAEAGFTPQAEEVPEEEDPFWS